MVCNVIITVVFLFYFPTEKVVTLLRIMDNECQDRHNYLNAALRWTIKVEPNCKAGHPDLHEKCGMVFWQGENMLVENIDFLFCSTANVYVES